MGGGKGFKKVIGPIFIFLLISLFFSSTEAQICGRTIYTDIVALDQPFFYNRLGVFNPYGMMFALRRDVFEKIPDPANAGAFIPGKPLSDPTSAATPGQVMLRPDKRPRPIVLRMNVGDCLEINFQNLLAPARVDEEQPVTREVSIHVNGMQLRNSIADDGSFVGENASSLAVPGETRTYRFYAEFENGYHLYSMGSVTGAEGGGGTQAFGLFGIVNVEPRGAEWYRSQLTREEMVLAADANGNGTVDPEERAGDASTGQPIINYDAQYPDREPFITEGKAGLPILRMLDPDTRKIVHTDINAIITGPNRGDFRSGTHYPSTPVNPNQEKPFREFSVVFHDEIATIQAFPGFFLDPVLEHTLHSVRDGFAINYGTAGVGAEVIANRLGVGPMWDCAECKYEEFFLTSWVVADPAMLVDIPANAGLEGLGPGQRPSPRAVGRKATTALFPDDPANVNHGYINDQVKFRNIHAGPKEHHIFHLHTHQWVFSPQNDKSIYLDSQAIGPGSAYTYSIAYGGAGNRNKTFGDAIYHCHFYPHFAQGMWALFRVHDVFEEGTVLVNEGTSRLPFVLRDGRPVPGARALPDGEIEAGTPIPFVVPIPGYAMAPMPAKVQIDPADFRRVKVDEADLGAGKNPGFPFYIAGVAGHRPASPVLDLIDNGGLPRHIITSGTAVSSETRLDFAKDVRSAEAEEVPETGTPAELVAMQFHSQKFHPTFLTDGATPAQFRTNGAPAVRGAPYADPCIDDNGDPIRKLATPRFFNKDGELEFTLPHPVQFDAEEPRRYKGANIELDAVFNKLGWHHNQQRIISLWEDVADTRAGRRPAEPFVMRVNTLDCVEYWHTNLVPHVYDVDDYQVRTTTDVISQHIHLVKFDVTSSDGAANGWNYEDGTFSPGEVLERIEAINVNGGLKPFGGGLRRRLTPTNHPFFGIPGARTTVQRWFADPVLDNQGRDRTLGIAFTHDHFGPSTHQQVGLYGTLLIEPAGSQWVHNETATPLNTRADGGPTSWQAAILTPDPKDSFREFFLEQSEFQHAYERNWNGRVDRDSFRFAINPSVRIEEDHAIIAFPGACPGGVPRPCPEAISAEDPGFQVVNYRSEPIGLRIFDPAKIGPDGNPGAQADGRAGDLAFAFASIPRAIRDLNNVMTSCVRSTFVDPAERRPAPGDPLPRFQIGRPLRCPQLTQDVTRFDPATPILRVYNNDNVRIKIQVGATEESHYATIHGLKWLQEFANPNSGWRNSMHFGISEQFQLNMPILEDIGQEENRNDYLWSVGGSHDDLWTGLWGLLRSYNRERVQGDLFELPNNNVTPDGLFPIITNRDDFNGVCPNDAQERRYDITAVRAAEALPTTIPGVGRTLIYNSRPAVIPDLVAPPEGGGPPVTLEGGTGPLHDPTALLYVMTSDLNPDGTLREGTPIEPLILRANAGDCVEVTLRNRLPAVVPDLNNFYFYPPIVDRIEQRRPRQKNTFNANDTVPSSHVGLHVQLLDYNIQTSDGTNVGTNINTPNGPQTIPPGGVKTYQWYAGDLRLKRTGDTAEMVATPIEFGAVNLMPADKFEQVTKGLIGALVILPGGSTWEEDPGTRASATVTPPDGPEYRDFVAVAQTAVNWRWADNRPIPIIMDDPEDAGMKAFNYKTEPMWFRLGFPPQLGFSGQRDIQNANAFSNTLPVPGLGTPTGDPETPIYSAAPGTPFRLHVLEPGGTTRAKVITLHGHLWQREPYNAEDFDGDGVLDGPTRIADNPTSQKIGAQEGVGASNHFTLVPEHGAGGRFGVSGDYLYRMMDSFNTFGGMWGILSVQQPE